LAIFAILAASSLSSIGGFQAETFKKYASGPPLGALAHSVLYSFVQMQKCQYVSGLPLQDIDLKHHHALFTLYCILLWVLEAEDRSLEKSLKRKAAH
jgi:hypothetical protein